MIPEPKTPADVFAPKRHNITLERTLELAAACGFQFILHDSHVYHAATDNPADLTVVGEWAALFPEPGPTENRSSVGGLGRMTAAERHVWRAAYAAACGSPVRGRFTPLEVAHAAVADLRWLKDVVLAEIKHGLTLPAGDLVDAALEAMCADSAPL